MRRQERTPIRDINISRGCIRDREGERERRRETEVLKYTSCRIYVYVAPTGVRENERSPVELPGMVEAGIYDKYDSSIDTIAVR